MNSMAIVSVACNSAAAASGVPKEESQFWMSEIKYNAPQLQPMQKGGGGGVEAERRNGVIASLMVVSGTESVGFN